VTLVDTNVLIDLVQDDPTWADWSLEQLTLAQAKGPLFINVVGYAELVPALESRLVLDDFLKRSSIA
jgi:predicted nucleic acid-binding protein